MELFVFESSKAFEQWLSQNLNHPGVFLKIDKVHGTTLSPSEAVDVALCYGWIDGVSKRIDDQFYTKYFARRQKKSVWSPKNKNRVETLTALGLMTEHGMKAVEIAKQNGTWDDSYLPSKDFSLDVFVSLVKPYTMAYEHLNQMSLSVQKTYANHYFNAKKEETRQRRLMWIIDRLNQNLKPM